MKKNISKKESRFIELSEIKMNKQLLFYEVKNEIMNFYIHKLTDFESLSNTEIKKILDLMGNLTNGKYNKKIKNAIPEQFPFHKCYNAKIVITDDLEGCGNLELKISLSPSIDSKHKKQNLNDDYSWLGALNDDNSWLEALELKVETI
jgi:hypothetical protein